ncbi:putative Indole-3-acetic acid-amido synthetase GH3.6 [Quillaja saponaria]|uniref:Indole-3-acetic acid-amido synthetase GH3.6 n=1 Tax=Quillaja saponaria TaxID=32244 RepID=A0AAD7LK45_QUISA|nr:putative Indole-3-acetic acid-amido synthetase GH3.6 [Quillaja saponaria]
MEKKKIWWTEYNNKALSFIEEVTSKSNEIQKQVLTEILSQNANVEYLQKHGLKGHIDKETFKKVMPVVDYEYMKPYINRIANGDTSSILCSIPISEFCTSSATSGGESKLMPRTEDDRERRLLLLSLVMPVMDQFVSGLDKGKGMNFFFVKPEFKTPGGLVARPGTTIVLESTKLIKDKNQTYDPYANYTSPIEATLCPDWYQSMYAQLLCGLCQNSDVLYVGSFYASGLIRVIKFLENHWLLLCNDIRTGQLDSKIVDLAVREAVMKILKPNPGLADFIQAECSKTSWKGILIRLWPNTKYINTVVTGTMSQPSDVSYTFIPTLGYFEFLPVNRKDHGDTNSTSEQIASLNENQELTDLVDVELGREYEVVVTNYTGLYRCRVDEVELQNSVKHAANNLIQFDATLKEYTSYADMSSIPGHYVLYWEIRLNGQTPIPSSVFEDCCLLVEKSLNSEYRTLRVEDKSIGPLEIKVVENGTFDKLMDYAVRKDKSIGPLEIRVVENGTFDKLMDYAISKGISSSLYKTPRFVKHAPMIELLNSNVVSSYFSPKCLELIPAPAKEIKL